MTVILLILAVLVALGVAAFLALRAREQANAVPVRVAPRPTPPPPPPVFDLQPEPQAAEPEPVVIPESEPLPTITWPRQLDPSASLDDDARARLIGDLAKLRAAWCVPILERAVEEERDPQMRQAAREALEVSFRGAASRL